MTRAAGQETPRGSWPSPPRPASSPTPTSLPERNLISAEDKTNVVFCIHCACVLDKTSLSYAAPTNTTREFLGCSSHFEYSFQRFFVFGKDDIVRRLSLVKKSISILCNHYICKETFTDDPLDKGGYELDLVELETSCPIQGAGSDMVEGCGIGAHPNCLCCPGKVGIENLIRN